MIIFFFNEKKGFEMHIYRYNCIDFTEKSLSLHPEYMELKYLGHVH